ncbi:acyltransferase-domain-containing protein [Gymnopilus junonius]|uniref:Tafazzin family protein n=1 Tax=Gymnopilus junonius TaxID=109634 RepID=A0A9P5TH01_GYMJU|nr:acyltransferase-domain-containing protein [Gymnopilus junonius]
MSALTVTAVGLTCKAFLSSGLCSIQVSGLQILRDALQSPTRPLGQGVVTVCNHISTLDDPLVWGVLPAQYYLSSRTTRWALGASDVIFTNPVFSTFFALGQTLETFRGQGIYQKSIDVAIQKLNRGNWVHLFGEGKVNQPNTYPQDELGRAQLPRFKWGVGRILMEAKIPPVVIPMWVTGFDHLMPEGRPFPYKYLPCLGARLSVTFGKPVPADEIREALAVTKTDPDVDPSAILTPDDLRGWLGEESKERKKYGSARYYDEKMYASLIRQKITAIIHRDVEALGKSISGDLLANPLQDL